MYPFGTELWYQYTPGFTDVVNQLYTEVTGKRIEILVINLHTPETSTGLGEAINLNI